MVPVPVASPSATASPSPAPVAEVPAPPVPLVTNKIVPAPTAKAGGGTAPTTKVIEYNSGMVAEINAILATARKVNVNDSNYKCGFRMETSLPANDPTAQAACAIDGRVVNLFSDKSFGFRLADGLPPVVIAEIFNAPAYAALKELQRQKTELEKTSKTQTAQQGQIDGLVEGQKVIAGQNRENTQSLVQVKDQLNTLTNTTATANNTTAADRAKAKEDKAKTDKRLDRHFLYILGLFFVGVFVSGASFIMWTATNPAVPARTAGGFIAFLFFVVIVIAVTITLYFTVPNLFF
jgi:hypothetical protein